MPLESVYNPQEFEKNIYSKWVENGLGKPESQVTQSATYHSILMPPPNLTGDLHAGHAFQHFLSDTLCRHARLMGNKSLWYPGVDHAGLQLEGVVDKLIISGSLDEEIEKYKKNFANDDFLILTQALKNKDRSQLPSLIKQTIPSMWLDFAWSKVNLWRHNQQEQAKVLGDTPDYSRELFTLDEKANKMVNYAFREYWKDGLMYQGKYLINWSVGLQTALSDISGETDYLTRKDPFVTFLYKFESYKANNTLTYPIEELTLYLNNNPFKVATVRPETIHGDMAIAIHPEVFATQLASTGFDKFIISQIIEDIQSQSLILNFGIQPLGVKEVRLIVSDKVEKEFGTGVLKITPASDIVDYEIWNEAYPNVPFVSAINKQGSLTSVCGKYENQNRDEARLNIIFDLAKNGFIPTKEGFAPIELEEFKFTDYDKSVVELKEKLMVFDINFDYEHNVVICERSKTVVEHWTLIKRTWTRRFWTN
jgi:valyl-tRNA synthetase